MLKQLSLCVLCFTVGLTACTTTPSKPHANKMIQPGEDRVAYLTPHHQNKSGNTIAFYNEASTLKRPYRIIGKETISRYNFIGVERQTRALDKIMKNLAASMGGDAVINIKADHQKVEGTVIAFEKVLL